LVAEAEGREYEPLTQRGARVHAVRQAKAMFAEMRERLELARDAWAEAREEGQGHVSAGLAALRAAAGRQAKDWTRTRSSSAWRGLPGVIWARSMITRRGRAAGIYAAGLPMCWAKPGPKTRSGKRPARRNASRSWTKSEKRQRELDRDLGWELYSGRWIT
jgi:hypothetical protein